MPLAGVYTPFSKIRDQLKEESEENFFDRWIESIKVTNDGDAQHKLIRACESVAEAQAVLRDHPTTVTLSFRGSSTQEEEETLTDLGEV